MCREKDHLGCHILSENAMALLAGCAGIISEGAELTSDGRMKQVVDRWAPS
jgi:hypothetical protein